MRVFKFKAFAKWAKKLRLSDKALLKAVDEISKGLVDADLGGGVVKKRIALSGQGKSGGARTIIAYKKGKSLFFMYGFAKNERDNIEDDELETFRELAEATLKYSNKELDTAVERGEFVEVSREKK